MQRVNEASFFEVTELQEVARTSKGFIMLRLARVVRQEEEFFPRLSAVFFKPAREPEGKLRHVVYEV